MSEHQVSRDEDLLADLQRTRELEALESAEAFATNDDLLDWHKAETERLRVLIDFLARPIHAPGGADPDPDVLTAYNLAVEAALTCVRSAAVPLDQRRSTPVR